MNNTSIYWRLLMLPVSDTFDKIAVLQEVRYSIHNDRGVDVVRNTSYWFVWSIRSTIWAFLSVWMKFISKNRFFKSADRFLNSSSHYLSILMIVVESVQCNWDLQLNKLTPNIRGPCNQLHICLFDRCFHNNFLLSINPALLVLIITSYITMST